MLAGIEAAAAEGFASLKIDSVVIRGVNDAELVALLERGRAWGAEVRFIEYMDVGGATLWTRDRVVSRAEILETLARHYGPIAPIVETSSAPAERFRLPDGMAFGIIASTTAPFCSSCDRSRLTADGLWYLCLYAARGWTCAARSAPELLRRSSPRSSRRAGAHARTGAPRSAWRCANGRLSCR